MSKGFNKPKDAKRTEFEKQDRNRKMRQCMCPELDVLQLKS